MRIARPIHIGLGVQTSLRVKGVEPFESAGEGAALDPGVALHRARCSGSVYASPASFKGALRALSRARCSGVGRAPAWRTAERHVIGARQIVRQPARFFSGA